MNSQVKQKKKATGSRSPFLRAPTKRLVPVFVAGFAAVGVILLLNARAAAPHGSVVVEGENTQRAGSLSIKSDTDASGGSFVEFGAPPSTGEFDFASYPNLTNTGIAGVGLTTAQLTPHSGNLSTSSDGQVIDMVYVSNGRVFINHNNVTIKRSYIHYDWQGAEADSTGYAVQIKTGVGGLVIEDTTIRGGNTSIVHGGYTLRRSQVFDYHSDGLRMGSNTFVYDSYIHSPRADSAAVAPHNDGIQSLGGNNGLIKHSTVEGQLTQTAAIIMHAHLAGNLSNFTFEDNLFSGAGYTINFDERNSSVFQNVVFQNNILLKCSGYYGPYDFDTQNFTNINNRYETGELISEVGAYKGVGAGASTCQERKLLYHHRPDLFYEPAGAVLN